MILSRIMKRAKRLKRYLIASLVSVSVLGLTGCTNRSPLLSSQLSNYLIKSTSISAIARNQFNNTLSYECGKQDYSSDVVLHNGRVGFSDGNSDASDDKQLRGYAFNWDDDYKSKFYDTYQNDRFISDFVTPADLAYDAHHEPSIHYRINNRKKTLTLSSPVNNDTLAIKYKLRRTTNYLNSETSYEFSPVRVKCTNKYNRAYRHDKSHKTDLILDVHNNNWNRVS